MLTGLRGQNWSGQDHGVSTSSATWPSWEGKRPTRIRLARWWLL